MEVPPIPPLPEARMRGNPIAHVAPDMNVSRPTANTGTVALIGIVARSMGGLRCSVDER